MNAMGGTFDRCGSRCTVDAMTHLGWNLILRLMLVLGLAAGPGPAVLAAFAPSAHPQQSAAQQVAVDVTPPCPMDEPTAAANPCDCCDAATPCPGVACVGSLAVPGLPVRASELIDVRDDAIHDSTIVPSPPRPGPRERLRPPIV